MEIEHEHQGAATIDELFHVFMDRQLLNEVIFEQVVLFIEFLHFPIKIVQPLVAQTITIREVPLSASAMARVIFSRTWKIDPLRMTEPIAH